MSDSDSDEYHGTGLTDQQLRSLGQRMMNSIPVHDRTHNLRKYKNVFTGKEAYQWMATDPQIVETGARIIDVGNEMMKIGVFDHVTGDHSFKNKDLFYCFRLDRVMKRMYNELSIEDRKFHFRTYHRVFVGKEAVSFLVEQGIVRSRPDGVVLGERLRARGDFHHVTKEHVFHDKELFYRFAMDE